MSKKKESQAKKQKTPSKLRIIVSSILIGYPLMALDAFKKWKKDRKFWEHIDSCNNSSFISLVISMIASFAISIVLVIVNWSSITACFEDIKNIQNTLENSDTSELQAIMHHSAATTTTAISSVPTPTENPTTTSTIVKYENYVFSEDDIFLIASLVEQETGDDYLHPYIVDNDFDLYPVEIDLAQQCIVRLLINQMFDGGMSSVREALSSSTFKNSLSTFDKNPKTLSSFDDRIWKNINLVLSGKSTVPNNIQYAMCTDPDVPEQYTHDIRLAYQFMQSNYNDELDVYMFSKNSDGSWWLACSVH